MTAKRPPGCTPGGMVTAYVMERPGVLPRGGGGFDPGVVVARRAAAVLALSLKELVAERAA